MSSGPRSSAQPEGAGDGEARSMRPCPICGKLALKAYHPFCSKRCADIDLHRWLSGVYSIPAVEAEEVPDGESGEGDGE